MAEMNPLIQSDNNPQSRKLAIKAMCAHCMGCTREELEPGFRQAITACTACKCPLYKFRPFQKETDDADSIAA